MLVSWCLEWNHFLIKEEIINILQTQPTANDVAQKKTKVWEKQKKKNKGKSSKKSKKANKPVRKPATAQPNSGGDTNKDATDEHSTQSTPKKVTSCTSFEIMVKFPDSSTTLLIFLLCVIFLWSLVVLDMVVKVLGNTKVECHEIYLKLCMVPSQMSFCTMILYSYSNLRLFTATCIAIIVECSHQAIHVSFARPASRSINIKAYIGQFLLHFYFIITP